MVGTRGWCSTTSLQYFVFAFFFGSAQSKEMFIHGIAAFINRDVKLPPFTHNKITSGYYVRSTTIRTSSYSAAAAAAALVGRFPVDESGDDSVRENSKDYNIANLKWSIKILGKCSEHTHTHSDTVHKRPSTIIHRELRRVVDDGSDLCPR